MVMGYSVITHQNGAAFAHCRFVPKRQRRPLPVHFSPFTPLQPHNLTKRDNSMSTPDMARKADWKSHLSL
jgi:hypothetical protein